MSVWEPCKLPLIIISQDECVFSQFLLTSKMWIGPHTEMPLLPKSEGDGQIISAMPSRDFGFGLQIHEDQLAQVNESQKEQSYLHTTAMTEVFGCINKTTTCWVIVYPVHDGYWNSYHMTIQLEDCIECLRVYPQHDFHFMFDHSQGHTN